MKKFALILALALAVPLAAQPAAAPASQQAHHSQFDAANAADQADGPGA
jgi:hypothetical protein